MPRIEGKICIVTGAGSGIGRAIAIRFAEEGGKVMCVDQNGASALETRDLIASAGGLARAFTADVSDPARVLEFVLACAAEFGRVDVLVNNAGVNIPGLLHEVTDEVIDKILNVNVKGAIYSCRAVLPFMLEQGSGSIVNISSVNGLVSEPFLSVYSASKGLLIRNGALFTSASIVDDQR